MLKFYSCLFLFIIVINYASPMIHGRNAGDEEFRFMASLAVKNRLSEIKLTENKIIDYPDGHFCGGAILNKNWVVTAAHCFFFWFLDNEANKRNDELIKEEVLINVGNHKLYTDNPQSYSVAEVISHPKFSKWTFQNDIALVRVAEPITFGPNVKKIHMAPNDWIGPGQYVSMAGWGFTSIRGDTRAETLQILDSSEVINPNECKEKNLQINLDSLLCLIDDPGTGICKMDSGGPVVVKSKDNLYLVGVISYGHGLKCAVGKPDRISKIAFHKQWIEETMCSYENSLIGGGESTFCKLRRLIGI